MEKSTKTWIAWIVGSAIVASALILTLTPKAHAADKGADIGGQCCTDLEERVAELEATVAHKGNRKITLTIDGHINEAYVYTDIGSYHNGRITENGNDRSYVGFSGAANIMPGLTAGYRIEIDLAQLGLLNAPIGTDSKTETRQSYWWIKSETLGKISLGKTAQATQDFDKWSVDDAWIAGKPLSVGSLSDLYLSGVDLPFDGNYRNVVRYDSPKWEGFRVSATWGDSADAFSHDGNGNTYDVALTYSGEPIKNFATAAAVGYRHDTDFEVDLIGLTTLVLSTGDVNTFLATGSVKYIPLGTFINVEYAHQDWNTIGFTLEGLDVTAGVEEEFFPVLGKTTLFGTWGRVSFEPDGSANTDIDYYGLGAVQAINAAAMDLYVGWRHYNTSDILGSDADVVTAGAKIDF